MGASPDQEKGDSPASGEHDSPENSGQEQAHADEHAEKPGSETSGCGVTRVRSAADRPAYLLAVALGLLLATARRHGRTTGA